jgi:hypothetical protein
MKGEEKEQGQQATDHLILFLFETTPLSTLLKHKSIQGNFLGSVL